MPENPFITTDAELLELGVLSRGSWERIYPIHNFVPRSDGFPYLPGVGAIGPLNMNNHDFCRAKICDYMFFPDDVQLRFGNKAKDHNAHIVLDGTDWLFRARISDSAKFLFNATGTNFSPDEVFHFRGTPSAATDPVMKFENSHASGPGVIQHTEEKGLNIAGAVGAYTYQNRFKHEDSGGEKNGPLLSYLFDSSTDNATFQIHSVKSGVDKVSITTFPGGEVLIGNSTLISATAPLMVKDDGVNTNTIQMMSSPSVFAAESLTGSPNDFKIKGRILTHELRKLNMDGNLRAATVGKGFVNGDNNNVSLSEGMIQRVSGPTAAFTVTGMVTSEGVNQDGDWIILQNATSQIMTIKHENASSAAANRFLTPIVADINFNAGSNVMFLYDSTTARWRMMEAEAAGGTGLFTQGSVIFAGTSGELVEDNANLFWDDTNNRLGIGTTVPVSNLEAFGSLGLKVRTVTTTSTAGNEVVILVNNTSAATINLPAVATVTNRVYIIKKLSSTGGGRKVTVDPNAAEQIDGSATLVLNSSNESVTIISDGTEWRIIV